MAKRAIVSVSQEFFEELFDFPKGTTILTIREDISRRTLDFVIQSPYLDEVEEGYELPRIPVTVTDLEEKKRIFVTENISIEKNKRFQLEL